MVSIIVPVYNIKQYLPRCVKSLLGQSYKELEIVLVDDGSNDGSGALCDSLAASEARVRAVHKENGGLSDARNAGIDAAKGQWLLFVDGDDYLVPHAVERLMAFARADVDFVQFRYQETDGTWLPGEQTAQETVCTDPGEMFAKLYELGGVAASSCTKLWNRRVFDGVRFQKGIRHEDEELLNRVLPRCRKVIYTELALYGYVMRSGSIVHSDFRPGHMDIFPIMESRLSVLEGLGLVALARETQRRLFQTAAWQYCLAKKGGFREEAAQLKKRLLDLAKVPGLNLSGQYKLLYRLARVFPAAPEIYYCIRRVCGKS